MRLKTVYRFQAVKIGKSYYIRNLIASFVWFWVLDSADRCAVNNPCEHHCVDTGSAVTCRCYDGFMLEVDGRSCEGLLKL